MKRAMAWILTAAMLLGLMAGCGKQSPAAQTPREPGEKVMEQVRQGLAMRLSLTEEQAEDLVVTDARDYGDESIIRYSQVWQGVEIYGSSIVTTSEDETFAMGAYYDLSEAFGEDFDTLVAQAAQAPAWMTDQTAEDLAVRFDRDSLRPVIYITEDQTALVARCFTVAVEYEGQTHWAEVVTDISGDCCYRWVNLDFTAGFSDTDVKSRLEDSCTVVKEDGVYYAYNQTYHFYAANRIYASSGDIDEEDYWEKKNGRLVLKSQDLPVFSRDSNDWTTGDADLILRAMNSYYDVADWYFKKFGYYCLDGQGGLGAVIVARDVEDTVAYNDSNIMIVIEPDVVKATEVLVHEYGHTVFGVSTGTVGPTLNQPLALQEAICDVFAALYLADQGDASWIIGEGAGDPKNIPGTFMTMEDYLYDRSGEYAWAKDVPYEMTFWEQVKFAAIGGFGRGYELDTSNSAKSHQNAFIISNTLYRFWKNDLNKDSELLGKMLYRSLRYMPSRPDFSDFRSAFVYAAELFGGPGVAAAAGAQFDKAGIPADVAWNIVRVVKSQLNNKRLLAYCTADFAAISEAFRDSFYTTPDADGGNVWNCTCMIAQGLSIVFTFASDYEDPDATPIYATYDDLMYWSGGSTGAELAQGLNMGMTYAEAAKALDLTELEYAPEQHWTEPVFLVYGGAEDCALELYFVGTGEDNAVLVSVNAFPAG